MVSAVWISLGTGCLGFWSDSRIDVSVRNVDTQSHSFDLDISGDFQDVARQGNLDAGEQAVYDELIPVLDYNHEFTVEIAIDGEPVKSTTSTLDEVEPYVIIIQNTETVSTTCHRTLYTSFMRSQTVTIVTNGCL